MSNKLLSIEPKNLYIKHFLDMFKILFICLVLLIFLCLPIILLKSFDEYISYIKVSTGVFVFLSIAGPIARCNTMGKCTYNIYNDKVEVESPNAKQSRNWTDIKNVVLEQSFIDHIFNVGTIKFELFAKDTKGFPQFFVLTNIPDYKNIYNKVLNIKKNPDEYE